MQRHLLLTALCAGVLAAAAGLLGARRLAGGAAVVMLLLLLIAPWMKGPEEVLSTEARRRR